MAATRSTAAALLADGRVHELSSRPPEILLSGASVSHEAKWPSLGQRDMSVPISEINRRAVPVTVVVSRADPEERSTGVWALWRTPGAILASESAAFHDVSGLGGPAFARPSDARSSTKKIVFFDKVDSINCARSPSGTRNA